MSKPRIHRFMGYWICRNADWETVGYGRTPAQAFYYWIKNHYYSRILNGLVP